MKTQQILAIAVATAAAVTTTVTAAPTEPVALKQDGCYFFNRAWTKYDLISKNAIETGMESIGLSVMAYEYKGYLNDATEKPKWPEGHYPPDNFPQRLTNIKKSADIPDGGKLTGGFGFSALLDNNTPVLSFAGTVDSENTWHDMQSAFSTSADLGGEHPYLVGQGIYKEYREIMATLDEHVKEMLHQHDNKLLIVGHSLGGALANVAAVEMANKYGARVMLRTAGSMRAFAWRPDDSAEDIQQNLIDHDNNDVGVTAPSTNGKIVTQRWTNYNDIVPALPLCSGGYMHIGNGGLYIDSSITHNWNKMSAFGPQHQDFTPYQNALTEWSFKDVLPNHLTHNYYIRLMHARDNM